MKKINKGKNLPEKMTEPLRRHRAYVLNKPFYGVDPDTNRLRKYPREEVVRLLVLLFQSKIVVASTLDTHVTMLIVPDHWDRRLPANAHRIKGLIDIPLSFLLYPQITDPVKMAKVTAPPDAPFQILREELKPENFPEGDFVLPVAPNNQALFQQTLAQAAPTSTMKTRPPQHRHRSKSREPMHANHVSMAPEEQEEEEAAFTDTMYPPDFDQDTRDAWDTLRKYDQNRRRQQ